MRNRTRRTRADGERPADQREQNALGEVVTGEVQALGTERECESSSLAPPRLRAHQKQFATFAKAMSSTIDTAASRIHSVRLMPPITDVTEWR